MEINLNHRAVSTGARALLFALVISTSALSSLLSQLGILLLPLTSMLMTLLFLAERGKRPMLSVTASALVVILDFVFNALYSICIVTSAVLVYFSLTKSIFTKGECAITVTFIIAILFGYMMFSSAFFDLGKIDFNAALEYYGQIGDELRDEWMAAAEKMIAANTNANTKQTLTPEFFEAVFDAMLASTVSMVVIFAFVLTGIMFKLLGIFLPMMLTNKKSIVGWHFILTPAYAYTFIAAYFISMFFTNADTFSIAILNFVNVFTAIFAYLGFVFVLSILEQRFSSKFASLAVAVIALLIFNTAAAPLLAFAGTFAVIVYDKAKRIERGGNDFDKD